MRIFRSILAAVVALPLWAGAVTEVAPSARPAAQGLLLVWPKEERWTVASKKENDAIALVELVREGETLHDWTQIGTLMLFKGRRSASIRDAYDAFATRLVAGCPDARLKIHWIEPDAPLPRVIFSHECAKTPLGHAESGVSLLIQARDALYVVQRSQKAGSLDGDLVSRWVEWLKTARVIER